MADPADNPIYDALVIPNDALDKGGVEILRAGLIEDELYVTARPAFADPGTWGEVLGDITRRIARLYAVDGKYTHKDALAAIAGAYAADLGAPVIAEPRKPRAPARKAAAKRKTRRPAPRRKRPQSKSARKRR